VPPRVQPRDTGRIFEDPPPVFGLRVDDLRDLPLADQRRRAGARRRVLEQHLDVARARIPPVDAVGRARVPLDPASDLDSVAVVEGSRRLPIAVVERDRHLRPIAGRSRRGAGKDHVVHGGGPHRLVRGLAHHPTQGFEQVRLAAAVRADDAGQSARDHEVRRLDERLEPGKSQALDVHGATIDDSDSRREVGDGSVSTVPPRKSCRPGPCARDPECDKVSVPILGAGSAAGNADASVCGTLGPVDKPRDDT
jgi:hypothetical protein